MKFMLLIHVNHSDSDLAEEVYKKIGQEKIILGAAKSIFHLLDFYFIPGPRTVSSSSIVHGGHGNLKSFKL